MNLQEIGYLVLCLSPFMSLGVKWAVGHPIGIYLLTQLSSGIAGAELSERLFPARGPLAAYLIAASLVVVFTVLFGLVVRKLHAETMRGR